MGEWRAAAIGAAIPLVAGALFMLFGMGVDGYVGDIADERIAAQEQVLTREQFNAMQTQLATLTATQVQLVNTVNSLRDAILETR